MTQALAQARIAESEGEVPVGAVVVQANKIVGRGYNKNIRLCDPTAHAEIIALRDASERLGNHRLPGTTLYATLEPCAMCAGAMILARVDTVVIGAEDERAGAAGSVFDVLQNPFLNHRCHVVRGIDAVSSSELLRQFFRAKRS